MQVAIDRQLRPVRALPDRNFFLPAALILLGLVVWGFGPSFFWAFAHQSSHPTMLTDRGPVARGLFVVHGVAYTAWVLLYCAQSGLIAARNTAVHRRLGQTAVVLVPIIVVLGIAVAIEGLRVGFHGPGAPDVAFAASVIVWASEFGVMATLGLLRRRVPATHKRWMLLATMVLVGAATARVGPIRVIVPDWLDATALLLPALFAWDLATLKRLHPVTIWGVCVYLMIDIGTTPFMASPIGLALIRPIFG